MKIIVRNPYQIEDYYDCVSIRPIEYSSIDDLIKLIAEKKVEYIKNREESFARQQKQSEVIQKIKEDNNYDELVASAKPLNIALNAHFQLDKNLRTEIWWIEKRKNLEQGIKDIKSATEGIERLLRNLPYEGLKYENYLKVGNWSYYLGDDNIPEFYLLEEWFEKYK